MKKILIVFIAGLLVGGISVWYAFNISGQSVGGFVNYPTIKSGNASSSAMTVGFQVSVPVLTERSLRNSWSACYDSKSGGIGSIYLVLSDSVITATTTGVLVELQSGECYFSERQSVYADIVQAIGLSATTSNVLFVTETFSSN